MMAAAIASGTSRNNDFRTRLTNPKGSSMQEKQLQNSGIRTHNLIFARHGVSTN